MIGIILVGAIGIVVGVLCGIFAMCLVIAGKDDRNE